MVFLDFSNKKGSEQFMKKMKTSPLLSQTASSHIIDIYILINRNIMQYKLIV